MSGQSVFKDMVTVMQHGHTPLKVWSGKIDPEEYEQWRKDFIWEALHGMRYGQSFCNRFGLHDNHLFYNNGDIEWADNYIKKTYID
jgi:hypothetical protein